jgi:hypothetical protein
MAARWRNAPRALSAAAQGSQLLRSAFRKKVDRMLVEAQAGELQEQLARCAWVDAALALELRDRMLAQGVPIPDLLHLTTLSNMLSAAATDSRVPLAQQYLAGLSPAQVEALYRLPAALLGPRLGPPTPAAAAPLPSPQQQQQQVFSTKAKFMLERVPPLPALTPDAISNQPPKTAPGPHRKLFDLASTQGWTQLGNVTPIVALQDDALRALAPVLGSLVLQEHQNILQLNSLQHRDVLPALLEALCHCSANCAASLLPPLLQRAVTENILLRGLRPAALLALPGLAESPHFSAAWLADVCFCLHLCDARFDPEDVDAIVTAASMLSHSASDAVTLRPLVAMVLPGNQLIEFLERQQLASVAASSPALNQHVLAVSRLLLEHSAAKGDRGALQHVIQTLLRCASRRGNG